jgi:hypothetical protein
MVSNSIIFLSRSNFGHGCTCRPVTLFFHVLPFCVGRGIHFVFTKCRVCPSVFPQISSQNILNGFRLNSVLIPVVFIGQSKPLLFTKLHWNIMNYLKKYLIIGKCTWPNILLDILYFILYIFYFLCIIRFPTFMHTFSMWLMLHATSNNFKRKYCY